MNIVLLLFACCWYVGRAQPLSCADDDQCTEGFFCEQPPGHCRKCLSCEDLKRESKPYPTTCTKTIGDCGPCYPGLINHPSGNLNAQCVPGSAAPPVASSNSGPPSYLWVAIGVGAVLILLIVVLVVYVLRKNVTFKVLTSTRASFQPPCAGAGEASPSPAPLAPPPYNYLPVRPTSPPPPQELMQPDIVPPPLPESQSVPLVKRLASGRRRVAERERAGSQEARVFNYPHYVRAPDPPPSYDSTLSDDDDTTPQMQDDENTMESIWTPNQNALVLPNGAPPAAAPGSDAELSILLSEARGTTVIRPPMAADQEPTPNKVPCLRQDTNNTGNRYGASNGSSSGASDESSTSGPVPPPGPPPALTFNITLQQHNDLKLIRT